MSFQTQLQNLKALNLPPKEFVIVSSGSLAVRGIREAKDLDVIVSDKLWTELTKRYSVFEKDGVQRIDCGNDIEILENDSGKTITHLIPVSEVFANADTIDGIQYMNLEQLKKIKLHFGREKDLKDIALIDEYLKNK